MKLFKEVLNIVLLLAIILSLLSCSQSSGIQGITTNNFATNETRTNKTISSCPQSSGIQEITANNFSTKETKNNKTIYFGESQDDVKKDFGDKINSNILQGNYGVGAKYQYGKVVCIVVSQNDFGNSFTTPRGITIGDAKEKVINKYGEPSNRNNDSEYSYLFEQKDHGFELVKNLLEIPESEMMKDYLIQFRFNKQNKVDTIWISTYKYYNDYYFYGYDDNNKYDELIPYK